ncbi:hypothetical protein BT96DRAFT_877180, partial [Gymnopus androsaceus JB14]
MLLPFISNTSANVVPNITELVPTSTGIDCRDINNCRTTLQILWSCLTVLIACTWVSTHPNIPRPTESSARVLVQKIGLMIVSLIAPEMMVLWACRDWIAARVLTKRFEEKGWTKTHAYFTLMGGFALYEGNELVSVLRFMPPGITRKERRKIWQYFHCFINDDDIQLNERSIVAHADSIGRISEHEVKDRSHSDGFSKLITVTQTSWLITQIIARAAQRLAVTELEIMTSAFAVININLYFFWWNKPQGIRYHIHI